MEVLFINSILHHDWYGLCIKLAYQGLAWVFVLFACFIDLKTGITASKANGVFRTSSYGLRQTLKKFKDYMDVFLMAFVIDVFLSIFNTMADTYTFLSIFSLPLVTITIFIYTMATELISILENKRKAKGTPIYTPEAINSINEITKVLGINGVEKLSQFIKDNTEVAAAKKGITEQLNAKNND